MKAAFFCLFFTIESVCFGVPPVARELPWEPIVKRTLKVPVAQGFCIVALAKPQLHPWLWQDKDGRTIKKVGLSVMKSENFWETNYNSENSWTSVLFDETLSIYLVSFPNGGFVVANRIFLDLKPETLIVVARGAVIRVEEGAGVGDVLEFSPFDFPFRELEVIDVSSKLDSLSVSQKGKIATMWANLKDR